ncbi:MAG: ArsR/SmtB family transcription factor [Candidatus Hermodarchaeota archaeon]
MITINIERADEIRKMLCSCNGTCDMSGYFENLQKYGRELKVNEVYKDLEQFSNALSSKERLIILNSLREKDRCVCELEAILDKAQSTISHHLRKLERVNLIRSWKKGNYTYYGLEKENLNSYLKVLNKELNST